MEKPTVLVLASGRGERFIASGGQGSKLHAMVAGKTVLERTLDAVRASAMPWHLEDAGHAGMGDSIAAAVRATRDADGWLVLPGDLPLVAPSSLLAVAQGLAGHEVVVPFHRGTRGHPVGFARACLAELLALHGEEGAAAVVRARESPMLKLDLDDAGIVADVDTVADLERVRKMIASKAP